MRACTSSNSRVLSIAITAWSAKVCSSAICCGVNGLHHGPAQQQAADRLILAHQRDAKGGAMAELLGDLAAERELVAGGGEVVHVDHLPVQDGAPGHPAAPERSARSDRDRAAMRLDMKLVTFPQQDRGVVGGAQPGRRFHQRVEHRLQIEGRAADHLEHVGGGGLLLQRFAQLVEQPRVLDGDDRLGGEILDQLDLLVGERADLLAVDRRSCRSNRSP